jgi:elongation factor P
MLTTADFKRGARILVEGEPYLIMDYSVQTPSARGAATLVRAKLRNIVTGAVFDRTFKAGEKFEEPDVQFRQVQFLYRDGESATFMDLGSYEQLTLSVDKMGDGVVWLSDGLEVRAIVYNGAVASIDLPAFVEAEVQMAGAGSRGDTASGKNLKDAVLENGVTVRVPLFIETGDRIVVDTRTGEFSRRAGKE